MAPFAASPDDITYVNAHDYTGQALGNPGYGKRVWMDEFTFLENYPGMTGAGGGLALAAQVHRLFTTWGASGASAYTYINAGANEKTYARAYVLGNFARFVRPGHRRISAVGAPAGVSATAYSGTDGSRTVVAINVNSTMTQLDVSGLTGTASVDPWITDDSRKLEQASRVHVSSGAFGYSLPPSSVVTFSTALSAYSTPPAGGGVTLYGRRPSGATVTVT
jgi:glucuronoarabinoxylan endo-1,4-beta-xylanase